MPQGVRITPASRGVGTRLGVAVPAVAHQRGHQGASTEPAQRLCAQDVCVIQRRMQHDQLNRSHGASWYLAQPCTGDRQFG